MKKLKLISTLLVVAMLASMVLAIIPASAAEVTADEGWYERETTDGTPNELEIDNAAELLAFATKLNDHNFKGQTVKLTANITLNAGLNAAEIDPYDNVDDTPAVVWPVTASGLTCTFAGTFDGQGNVLSGIYYYNDGPNIGLFGNVASATEAVVKNVIITDSIIIGNGEGIGTIFGQIMDPIYITGDKLYGTDTKATIDNVYLDTVVANLSLGGNTNMGTGGFIGGSRALVDVKDSAFVGTVYGGVRGVGAVAGQTRGLETTIKADGSRADKALHPTTQHLTVENCYLAGHLVGCNASFYSGGFQSFVGGIVGYCNNASDNVTATNVICNNTFGTRIPNPTLVNGAEKDPYEDPVWKVLGENQTRKTLYYTGYIYGGNWGAQSTNNAGETIYQTWTMTDVYYVKTCDRDTSDFIWGQFPVFAPVKTAKWTINGTPVNLTVTYSEATRDGEKVSSNAILYDLNGDKVTNATGEQVYATSAQKPACQLMAMAWEPYALEKTDVDTAEKWNDFLTDRKWTTAWKVVNGMPMVNALADMYNNNEAAEMTSTSQEVDANWYTNEGKNNTYNIYNASDLLAFAAELNKGTSFADKTVVMLNNVAADNMTWNVTGSFDGTFNGNGKTISGLNATTSFFGSVAAGKTVNVSNLRVQESTLNGLFGTVSGTVTVDSVWVAVASAKAAVFETVAAGANATLTNSIIGGTPMTAIVADAVAGTLTVTDVLNESAKTEIKASGAGTVNATNFAVDHDASAAMTGDKWVQVGSFAVPTTIYNMFYNGLIAQSLTLTDTIALNIYVKLDAQTPVEATFTRDNGNEDDTDDDTVVTSTIGEGGLHKFTLTGLQAQNMVDEITFTYGTYTVTTSIKSYAVVLMETDATLASALLRWGDAAQTLANYKTDNMATAGVEGLTAANDTTASLTNTATRTGTASDDFFIDSVAMEVRNGRLILNVKMKFKDLSQQQCLKAQTGDKEAVYLTFKNIAEVEDENRMYTVVFYDFDFSNMDDSLTFVQKIRPTDSADELGQTYTTNLDSIIADFMASDASDADKAYVKAMHAISAALAD